MTKILIQPISPDTPGSYRLSINLMRVAARAQANPEDPDAVVEMFDTVERYLRKFATTDDGTPVEEAIELLSMNDMMEIVDGLLAESTFVPKGSEEISDAG